VRSGKSKLSLKPSKGKLSYSWKKGEETPIGALGDPTADTDYAFCLYRSAGGVPSRVLAEVVGAGPGWKAKKNGFAWKGAKGTSGVAKVKLKAGAAGKSKASVKGKGLSLPALPLASDEAFIGQLAAATGACWTATFPAPSKGNTAKKFKGRSE
jgi:hypothetical protein